MKKPKLKKILLIAGTALLVLWFGANGAMYLYTVKTLIFPENEKYMYSIPEAMVLDIPPAEGVSIELMGLRMNLPPGALELNQMSIAFDGHKIWLISFLFGKESGYGSITFESSEDYEASFGNIIHKACDENLGSYYEFNRSIYYTNPNDFSLWNLPCNYLLTLKLFLKATNPSSSMAYEVKTAYLEGFILDNSLQNDEKLSLIDMNILLGDKYMKMSYIGKRESNRELLMKSIIASMRPADGSLPLPEASQLPEELSLVLLMDREGVTIERLERLREIMKRKGYWEDFISIIDKEIEALKTN